MDFRGTPIVGIWIGTVGIIASLNYFGILADASTPIVIVALILMINIMRHNPSEALEEGLK